MCWLVCSTAEAAAVSERRQRLHTLIFKLGAIDALPTHASAVSEVATLQHEARDDTMHLAALVVQGLARGTHALLAGA